MRFYKYDKLKLELAVKNNYSLAGVLSELGIRVAGGNYQTIKSAIKKFNLDISHFTGQGHYKGKTHTNNTRNLEQILVYGKFENTYQLKNRLLKDKVKNYICESCSITEWLGKPVPLELHHVDGDRLNNRLENINFLCPNCHALTENYRGKNKSLSSPTGSRQRT